MRIDSTVYSGRCVCGRDHPMVTRTAVIEPGCLKNWEGYWEEYGMHGRRCALYDENSYAAVWDRRPRAEQEIVLSPEGMHADESSTARVLEQLDPETEWILAVGSGTVNDIARFCAHRRGIRFLSFPTAAGMDGYCSVMASLTWYGYKTALAAVAPEMVIADLEVIAKAPPEMVRSGVGDILAKYIALAEWQIAHLVTGEYLCPRILGIMQEAADAVTESIPALEHNDLSAYEHITYALIMSGIAMQMMGNSRPASGAEHHISHLIEMNPPGLSVRFPTMHGEKTGVGTLLAAREYERLGKTEDITPYLKPYAPIDPERCSTFFGPHLMEDVQKENQQDCLAAVTPEHLAECWPDIRRILGQIPSSERLYGLLEQLGAKREMEDIGVSSAELDRILEFSPLVRNRLTLMRMRRMISL